MRTLIAGFGNPLRGDDGFGVEVVRRLAAKGLPPEAEAFEAGAAGMDFVAKLMEGFEVVIVIDAVTGGQAPGTLYVFEPDSGPGSHDQSHRDAPVHTEASELTAAAPTGIALRHGALDASSTGVLDPHTAEPCSALRLAGALGVLPPKVTVVGCEPETCLLNASLSPSVRAAVDRAAIKVREIAGLS